MHVRTLRLQTGTESKLSTAQNERQRELDEPGKSARWRTIRTVAAVAQWQSSRLVSGRSSVRSRPAAPTSRLAETVRSLSFLQRPAGLPLSAIGKRGAP